MLINYHIHTGASVDAVGKVDEYCKRAVALGFEEICFTNHHEWDSVSSGSYNFAMTGTGWKAHISEVEKARDKFPDLSIKLGVELGHENNHVREIKRFLKSYPFDYVLGSVHFARGILFAKPEMPPGFSVEEIHDIYYENLLGMIKSDYCDCIGHFDVFQKSTPYISVDHYRHHIEKCIEAMKENDIGFELNTRGWHYANRKSYPSDRILKMLQKNHIRKVTIGSDAHKVESFEFGIKRGMGLLKRAGFRSICTFSARRPMYHPL